MFRTSFSSNPRSSGEQGGKRTDHAMLGEFQREAFAVVTDDNFPMSSLASPLSSQFGKLGGEVELLQGSRAGVKAALRTFQRAGRAA